MEIIGRHKYKHLKEKKGELSDWETKQVQHYERENSLPSILDSEKMRKYLKEVREYTKEKRAFKMDSKTLWHYFQEYYKKNEGVAYSKNDTNIENLKPLIYYFTKDKRFFECKNLKTAFDFGEFQRETVPSFKKGLLIVGSYGNGKTSSLNALATILNNFPDEKIKRYSAKKIVEMYEGCKDAEAKQAFWKSVVFPRVYYDDVMSERLASNYGKSNIMEEVIEKNYEVGNTIHLSCNPPEDGDGTSESAILKLGEKYSGRVFDRSFSMWNVIEFKGKSNRK